MSEFKFACPVCGQHITADSAGSGTRINCPTCFRKIIVPQAPAAGDTKFVLSAAQADKPRPTLPGSNLEPAVVRTSSKGQLISAGVLLVALCATAIASYKWRGKIANLITGPKPAPTNVIAKLPPPPAPRYPVPTNIAWTLELSNAVIPEARVEGSIHNHGFVCGRAELRGGELTLHQDKGWGPNLSLAIRLPQWEGEQWSGKRVELGAEQTPPVPPVLLWWKEEQKSAGKKTITNGYVLKLAFGPAANGRLPGKIYVALPDEARSFASGSFTADIRAAKPKPQTTSKPKAPPKPSKPTT